MSQLSNTGIRDEVSESADSEGTLDTESSFSGCNSSSSVVTNAVHAEKSLEGSASLETAWTDSKHSSYLDFMEANFVQNMFARSYCVEDVCGGTTHHQQHRQQQQQQHDDYYSGIEENDYNSAQSQLDPRETLEVKMYDSGDCTWRPTLRSKAPACTPWVLLANPWVKHFRPRNSSSVSSKTSTLPSGNDELAKRDVQSPETVRALINGVGHYQETSKSILGAENPRKRVGVSGRITHLKSGQLKDFILNASHTAMVDRSVLRKKRRVLWSTYKQVYKTRQKTGNYVRSHNTFNQDGVALPTKLLDSVSEGDAVLQEL